MSSFRREFDEWYRACLRAIPGRIGERLRAKLYGYHCDANVRVLSDVTVYHPNRLRIGAGTGIAAGCQLNAAGGITIGHDVLIGPSTLIWSQNHIFQNRDKPIRLQGAEYGEILIEDDVWIGGRSVILPGVRLAKGTVVAAGAVVTKSTEPYSIVAGVPAKRVGERGSTTNVEPLKQ
jgi:maltose O-acetyltransferase